MTDTAGDEFEREEEIEQEYDDPADDFVAVRAITLEPGDGGLYPVYEIDRPENVYLLPEVENTYGTQFVPVSVLAAAEKPYNWDDEISRLVITRTQVRHALYRAGMVIESDVDPKHMIAALLDKGLLPILEE